MSTGLGVRIFLDCPSLAPLLEMLKALSSVRVVGRCWACSSAGVENFSEEVELFIATQGQSALKPREKFEWLVGVRRATRPGLKISPKRSKYSSRHKVNQG